LRQAQRRNVSRIVAALWLLPGAGVPGMASAAEEYPARPVRLVVPWTPGGPVDTLSRTIGKKWSERSGQQVIVDNRAGGNAVIGTELAARAAPDGYTLLMAATGPNSILPSLAKTLPYDAIKDFERVSLVATQCYVLFVQPTLPASNIKELLALAKTMPGQFTYSSAGSGSPSHLSGALFKLATGIDMEHVPYKGSVPAMLDVIGGRIT
jgi:tripartite-type tricarboxylate transporter receptor subunit TctC